MENVSTTTKRAGQYMPSVCLMFAVVISMAQVVESKREPIYTDKGTKACLVCHSGEKIRTVQTGVHGEINPMAKHGCEDCHGPGSFHVSRAHGGKGFPSMVLFSRDANSSSRDDQVRACLSCHTQEAGGIKPVVFLGSAHDTPLVSCPTCHSIHTDSDRMADQAQQTTTCYGCHSDKKAEHPRFKGTTITFDDLKCSTCHNVHKLVADGQ